MPALPLLIQPNARGRLSGGYLYNARLAQHGAWELEDVDPELLAATLAARSPARATLLDSIWLTERDAAPFFSLAERGARMGVMLHSFPSLIAATEAGAPPPAGPSAFEVAAIARFGLCVVPGRHYADLLSSLSPGVRVAVVEPGIDDIWRAPPRPRRGPCHLVSVGAVTPRKGFLDIAEILARRERDDFTWTVIGSLDVDPAYAARVARIASGLPQVKLLGQLSPSEVARQVRAADVLLMPSYDENQPLVLVEAMAASVPAVAYAAGAAASMIEHEREGLIAPIGDRSRLAAYLTELVEDEAKRQALAAGCWERQKRVPTWDQAARAAQRALSSELGGPGTA